MTSRERVDLALDLKKPDAVPLSIGSTSNDCFTKIALRRFSRHIGLPDYEEIVTWETVQTVSTPQSVKDKYKSDFYTVRFNAPDNPAPRIEYDDGTYLDGFGVRMQPVEYYRDAVSRPLEGPITLSDIQNYNWPNPYDAGLTRGLKDRVKEVYENTSHAIVVDFMVLGPFEGALWVRGWDDFLCDLYTDPKMAEAMMDKITDYALGTWDQMLTAVGEYVHVVCQGDDLGMQDRSIISPELFRKYVKKYTRKYYDLIHSKTKAKILHHSCGSCYELLDDLIDCGVQVLNPIQTSAAKMVPELLKKEFGDQLAFWGGLDVQTTLAFGTPEEVEKEVQKLMAVLGDGGGYVFAPSHNIQPNVPLENMEAMFEAALKYR